MERFGRVLERFALAVLLVGGAGMLTAMFLGTGDVAGTQFLGQPIPGAKEITESTMVLIVFGALAYAQLRGAHIRVELVYTHMGPRIQAAMDVVADLAAMVFFGFLLWQAWVEAMLSWKIGEAADGLLPLPLYPARWILVLGTVLLILRLVLDLIRDLGRLKTGETLDLHVQGPVLPNAPELRGTTE